MQELKMAVLAAFDKVVADGAIEKTIEAKITETINSAIADALRPYSDFGKQIKEAVGQAVQVDLADLGLPGYNDLILKIVRSQVDAHISGSAAAAVAAQLSDLLAPAPAEITLSKLIADFIEREAGRIDCHCDSDERISLHVRDEDCGMRWISFDKEQGKSEYQCQYRFLVTVKTGKIGALRLGGHDLEKTLFVDVYGFERDLFQMHAAGTRLVIDAEADDISTYYPGRD